MKLKQAPAPHIRFQESSITIMSDVILLLAVLTGMACFFYGIRALAVCGVSVGCAVAADTLCVILRGKRPNPRDLSPVVTGMVIAMAMPATISYQIAAVASLFAILIVKHPFGGTGHNPFNPAAAGFSFAAICWPQQIFSYPMPFEKLSLAGGFSEKAQAFVYSVGAGPSLHEVAVKLYQNPASVLRAHATPSNDLFEMLLGNFPGPMGATNILVILTCLCYLLFRNSVRWQLPISYLASCVFISFLFPRTFASGALPVFYEMMSGLLLFGGVFMLTDPVTSPKRESSMLIYGFFAGLITMLFRYFGGFEESVTFAILFANAFVPLIDRHSEHLHRLIRRKRLELRKAKNTQGA